MEYHSTGSPTARLGGSVPNPTDLSRRLLSTQQAQDAAESTSDDGATTPTPRSRVNSVTRFDIPPGTPFWGSFSPAPRSPVLIQCCCRREDCQNLLAFLSSTRSMEDELRLAAEVGQALLQKHELYQKEMENFRSALEHQCARAELKVQESEELIRELEDTQRVLIRERDDALRQKNILDEKNDTLVTALDKADSMLRDLDTELKARDNEIKRLMANNIKGERSEEREEMLRRQLEDLQQELSISRKSEMAAEMRVKKLSNKFDQLYNMHEKLKKEQIETQESKDKLEAVAMLRESIEKNHKSSPPNNEANNHLIALIKELSSANNKLKSEISEYRELLSESRNELSTLQNRIEDIETASTTGYAYPASYTSSVAFASPFKPNFPQHVLDEMGMGGIAGENLPNVNAEVEESGEGSTIPSGSAAKPIHPHASPMSSSFGPASYNTFNSLGVDPSVHSPAGSFVSTSALSSSNPLHHHHHYHHYHHYPNENLDIVRGSVFGELEKYLMKKTKHKRSGRSSIKGKKVFVEIGEEDEEQLKDGVNVTKTDTNEKKREIINENSDSDITYSDDSDEERDPEGVGKVIDKLKKEKSKSKSIKGQEKKKMRAFSSPDQNTSNQKQNVSLLSASLRRSAVENSKDELKGEKSLPKKHLSAIKRKDSKSSRAPSAPAPLNFSSKQGSDGKPISSGLKQHKPSQPSPLAVHRQTASAASSSLLVKEESQSSNSPAINPKSKIISTKPSIPAFKNPKFATLGPKERKQMMEIWRTGVAKEQLNNRDGDNHEEIETLVKGKDNSINIETVKGKSRMDSTNSPIKEFVEEVLVDEANFSAAEAAALANEVEHSLTTSAKSTHSRHASTATRHTSLHVPSITVQSLNEGFDSKTNPHPPESPQQQNPYQSLFNIGCYLMDRLKGTDLLALNRRLKRTFDILELSNLSNNLIENILADVEILRERFRWVEDLRKNDEIKTDEKGISGNYESNDNYDNFSQKDPFAFSPENFLPLTHFMQDLLTEICKLRIMINDVQVEYFQKVEASRRKAEEEFDRSVLSGKDDDEIIERRGRGRYSQSSDGGIGAYFSRVFGGVKEIQSPSTSARHHSRRLSVDFTHDRDVSVGSIDTFAEDSYFADRNLESYTNSSNALRGSKRRDSNETVGSMIRRNVVSFFGGGGGGNNTILGKKNVAEKVGKLVDGANGKKKFGTLTGHNIGAESFHHQQRLTSNENVLISASGNHCDNGNERSLLADISTTSPIRSPSSTTIQYIGSDGSPTNPQPISPPPPLTIITPRQTRLSTNNSNNLENRLRQHLASATPTNTVRIRDVINTNNREMETNEWNVVTILDKIFGGK